MKEASFEHFKKGFVIKRGKNNLNLLSLVPHFTHNQNGFETSLIFKKGNRSAWPARLRYIFICKNKNYERFIR